MFERPETGERAILIQVCFGHPGNEPDLEEFEELTRSAGAQTVAVARTARDRPHPRYFIGSGKADELKQQVRELQADVVLVNHELSPAQERNLERLVECRVIDRTRLILDIFAQRARSFEGKLQVELAQLKHLSTRLVRGWTHLERQKGGIGLRGPGETQLESDRRIIGQRIKQINERLKRVRAQRRQSARARKRALLSTVSIVGYTNAGKSTLFNQLAGSDIYAADQLFATLDTTLRKIDISGEHPILLSDTVGFIRDLPPELVAAFHATLEETTDAALLLHVVDASAEERGRHREEVHAVLERIGADKIPVLEVFNKVDLVPDAEPRIERDEQSRPRRVWISAAKAQGLHLLRESIAELINESKVRKRLHVPPQAARARAKLYEIGAVIDEAGLDDGSWALEVTMSTARWETMVTKTLPELASYVVASEAPEALPKDSTMETATL